MKCHTPLLLCLLTAAACAQGDEARPAQPAKRRSLADGLVRELIESQRLAPPRCESGLELAAGDGPLALLLRRADGTYAVRALQRGLGEHGEAPEMVQPVLVEEREEDAPAPKADGKKVEVATVKLTLAAPRAAAEGEPPLRELVVGTRLVAEHHRGANVDRNAMAKLLAEQFAATKTSAVARQLLVDAGPEVAFADVLLTVELAHRAGFTDVYFDGGAANVTRLSAENREAVLGLPNDLGWKPQRMLNGTIPVHEGELLVLVDGPAQWGDIAPIYMLCARAGIWRISLVGQKDMTTRFKLPTNLPVDRGR